MGEVDSPFGNACVSFFVLFRFVSFCFVLLPGGSRGVRPGCSGAVACDRAGLHWSFWLGWL